MRAAFLLALVPSFSLNAFISLAAMFVVVEAALVFKDRTLPLP